MTAAKNKKAARAMRTAKSGRKTPKKGMSPSAEDGATTDGFSLAISRRIS